jgi:Putative Actinobacterial Holin-X, holin superfamily III
MSEPLLQTPPDEAREADNGPSLTQLVTGLIDDAEKLFKQQVELVRVEIRNDIRKTKEAARYMGIGAGVAALGGVVLALALVHLLAWLAPGLALWACYAIVGGVLAVAGGALVYTGRRIFESFNPLPEQSAEGIQENVQWLTNGRK